MERTDVAVIGAGLLGCFSARSLSALEVDVVVLEAREDVCTGISRANTGIVYSGCDTRPDTLKSRLTVRNSIAFPALCRELDVPFSPCGSLMVSFEAQGEAVVRQKYAQGLRNGAPGLQLLGREAALALEPELSEKITLALYSPTTGTVDPWALGIAAFENAQANGAHFRFLSPVEHMERRDGGFALETPRGALLARCVINCAGLRAGAVRELIERPRLRLFPSAGDYLILDHAAPHCPRHVIFQQCPRGKGVTLVPTVDGSLLIGPTERAVEGEGDLTSTAGLAWLRERSREVMPALPLDAVIRCFAARRPDPYYVRETAEGWVREAQSIHGFPLLEEAGLISLLGVKTPGLTCAQGLGEYAAQKAAAFLGGAAPKQDFSPCRRGIPRVRTLPEEERAALIERDAAYGRVLCLCRDVTEGEVLEAIRRGAVTVDGVKRRVGSGMGRCQGSRCGEAIAALLAQRLGKPARELLLGGSDFCPATEAHDGAL